MAIKVIPDGSRKGGGGMDIGKTPKKRPSTRKMKKEKPASRVSDQDVKRLAAKIASASRAAKSAEELSRAFSIARGMVSPAYVAAESAIRKGTKKPSKKAGGGKAKKMMAGGGKTKKMMRGGGKTKKYMARGGKVR